MMGKKRQATVTEPADGERNIRIEADDPLAIATC